MNEEPNYSIKEIIELRGSRLRNDFQEMKNTLKDQNIQTEKRFAQIEKRFAQLEKDIDDLRLESAKYKTIWGIGATIGASIVAVIVGRFS